MEFCNIQLQRHIRELVDKHQSKIPQEFRKQKQITKFEDLSYIIYTDQPDIALLLYTEWQNGDLRDLCLRGGDIEDIALIQRGKFPPDCEIGAYNDIKLGVLWFINHDPKCPRCWKRYKTVEENGLCKRCHDVIY